VEAGAGGGRVLLLSLAYHSHLSESHFGDIPPAGERGLTGVAVVPFLFVFVSADAFGRKGVD